MGMFDFLNKKSATTITVINIKLQGFMHSMKGMQTSEDPFTIEIPFTNKTHTDMLTDSAQFKAQKTGPIRIKGIEVAEPFKLVAIEPKPPMDINADQKIMFRMSVRAPGHNYTGPMSISFLSDEIEMVHIEISKTMLEAKGKKTEIETSSRILNIPKGQIFAEKIQLYKAFSYGDSINKIEIEKPFSFVSSDPKLPLKIDDPNSYILNIYIQAPTSAYAGTLDIKLS